MIVLTSNSEGADLRVSLDELSLLSNLVNEVCNGLHFEDTEFQTRLGRDRTAALDLLAGLRNALEHYSRSDTG